MFFVSEYKLIEACIYLVLGNTAKPCDDINFQINKHVHCYLKLKKEIMIHADFCLRGSFQYTITNHRLFVRQKQYIEKNIYLLYSRATEAAKA